jgi:hypothetical protein
MDGETRNNNLERILNRIVLAGSGLALGGSVVSTAGVYSPSTNLIYTGSGMMVGGAACFVAAEFLENYMIKKINRGHNN